MLEVAVGISGVLILVGAATTSFSGITRLTYSLAEHGSLPREFARLERRAVVSSEAIAIAAALAIGLLVLTELAADGDPGVPREPLLVRRPHRIHCGAARGDPAPHARARARAAVPRAAERLDRGIRCRWRHSSALRSRSAIWVLAMITHGAPAMPARSGSLAGLVVFVVVRRREAGAARACRAGRGASAGAEFARILVPMKLGDIGEEMVATAIALAKERGAEIEAITVVRVPRKFALEGELPPEVAARVDASLEEARRSVTITASRCTATSSVRARSVTRSSTEASVADADLIVLGSSPRWRRQSRFFSPTVDFVLRNAPCEVLVVAFPDGVFEE